MLEFRFPAYSLTLACIICMAGAALAQDDAPSLKNTAAASPLANPQPGPPPRLPSDSGQVWQEYDLKPYTKELAKVDRPHQAIIDWVLRETGSDAWFTDPFGFINADRETLRVYHNRQMHQVVKGVYERFVNGTTEPQLFGLRIMAVGNANWRTRAHSLVTTVQAQSPGVQAFLMSKENAALLMALLRGRSDYREISALDMVVHNGQAQTFQQVRSRNFIDNYRVAAGAWPPYMPTTAEITEGYQLQLSPLMSLDGKSVDLVIKCNIDQVEKLNKVNLELPLQNGQVFPGQINVPQIASWRLHERFRWPSEQVLLLSCGVVAAPQGQANATLLGQGTGLLGLDRLISSTGSRADALLMIEYRGNANARLSPGQPPATERVATPNPLSRGRY